MGLSALVIALCTRLLGVLLKQLMIALRQLQVKVTVSIRIA